MLIKLKSKIKRSFSYFYNNKIVLGQNNIQQLLNPWSISFLLWTAYHFILTPLVFSDETLEDSTVMMQLKLELFFIMSSFLCYYLLALTLQKDNVVLSVVFSFLAVMFIVYFPVAIYAVSDIETCKDISFTTGLLVTIKYIDLFIYYLFYFYALLSCLHVVFVCAGKVNYSFIYIAIITRYFFTVLVLGFRIYIYLIYEIIPIIPFYWVVIFFIVFSVVFRLFMINYDELIAEKLANSKLAELIYWFDIIFLLFVASCV